MSFGANGIETDTSSSNAEEIAALPDNSTGIFLKPLLPEAGALVHAPASFIFSIPAAPSFPMPVMTTPIAPLTARPAWRALQAHHEKIRDMHLRALFADDSKRGERLTAEASGLYLDYSKNRITDDTIRLLVRLAEECGLRERIAAIKRAYRAVYMSGKPMAEAKLELAGAARDLIGAAGMADLGHDAGVVAAAGQDEGVAVGEFGGRRRTDAGPLAAIGAASDHPASRVIIAAHTGQRAHGEHGGEAGRDRPAGAGDAFPDRPGVRADHGADLQAGRRLT